MSGRATVGRGPIDINWNTCTKKGHKGYRWYGNVPCPKCKTVSRVYVSDDEIEPTDWRKFNIRGR